MNLIEELGLEKCQAIVDGAPEGYRGFNLLLQKYTRGVWFSQDVSIAEFKAQIDHYYYGRSEEEELRAYAELSQEKIEGGAMLVGDFGEAKKRIHSAFEDDRTDYVSDIRNHIVPTTVVIYRHNKTGNLYSYIATANKCNNEKFPKMAVYQSLSDGNIYSRPYKDFFNAFTALRGEHEQ